MTEEGLLRSEKGVELRRCRCLATRHARAAEIRRRMVVGTGRLYPTQTGETSFQETTRRRGKSTSAVAGRSRRPVEFENRQRRYDLYSHGNRRLHESGLVHFAEEQIRNIVGDGAEKHVHRRLAKDVSNR